MNRFMLLLAGLVSCTLTAGCSRDTKRGDISGTVTLDGQPIKSGLIRFVPAAGQTASADTNIEDGKFSAKVPPGDKTVQISASKVVGKKKVYETPDSPTVDIVQELIPAKYNLQSTLKFTVAPGSQEKSFELTSSK